MVLGFFYVTSVFHTFRFLNKATKNILEPLSTYKKVLEVYILKLEILGQKV